MRMSSSLTKATLLRTFAVRGLSSCPAEAKGVPVGGYPDYQVETTTLPNKIVVASGENSSLISRVSVVFRAGARNETFDNLGAAHLLRISAGLSTPNATQFAIVRNLQEVGATLTCSVDREIIAYTLEGTRPAVQATLPYLCDVATNKSFKPWELSDNISRLKLELATRPPQLRAVDLLHKAAYRSRGLGNSIYIAKHNLNKISSETLQHYVAQTCIPSRCAVVGLGISHSELLSFVDSLPIQGDMYGKDAPSAYKGGEIRSDKGGDFAHIAIAGEGGALKNVKEALSFAILQRALGAGTYIKYTNENKSPFAKLLANDTEPNCVTAFNVSYSDSGLFGALITASSKNAGSLLESVVKVLKSGRASSEDFERGKRQTKIAVMLALENGCNGIEEMANQASLLGSVASPCEIMAALDGITTNDVNSAARKIGSGKLSIASVGNLHSVPFLDEITA